MPYDAREIANFFLDYAEEKSSSVTIMTLLKLIYFAHGWHLAKYNEPLINQPFEAWQYGPVVRTVYNDFKGAKSSPITSRSKVFNPINQKTTLAKGDFSPTLERFLKNIFEAYGHMNAFRLSDITHEKGSPWDTTWKGAHASVNVGMKIPNEAIQAHFLRKYTNSSTH